MKKRLISIIALVLSAVMLFSLAACGKKADETAAVADTAKSAEKDTAKAVKEKVEYSSFTLAYDSEIYNGENDYVVLRYTDDGLYAYENTAEGVSLYFISDEGECSYLAGFERIAATEARYSGSTPVFLDVYGDKLILIEKAYGYEENKDGDFDYIFTEYLRVLSKDGTEVSCVELKDVKEIGMDNGAALMSDGTLAVCDGEEVLCFNLKGNKTSSEKFDGNVKGLVKMQDGRIAVYTTGETAKLVILDGYKAKKAVEVQLPAEIPAGNLVTGAGEWDVCFTLGSSFYGVSIESGNMATLFNWVNAGVVSDELQAVRALDDGTASAIKYDYSYYHDSVSVNIVRIAGVEKGEDSREIVSIASIDANYGLWYDIIAYNLAGTIYRAELVDYSSYNTDGDNSGAFNKLKEDVAAGAAPDVIYVGQFTDEQFAEFGDNSYLEDLYVRLDEDIALSQRDYSAKALAAGEYNGSLLAVVPYFTVKSDIALTSVVGDGSDWSEEKANACLSEMEDGAKLYWSEEDAGEKSEYESLREGNCLLINQYVSSAYDVAGVLYSVGESITPVGASEISGQRTFGINASGKNTDKAWAFIGYFFNQEYQDGLSRQLPSNVHALKNIIMSDSIDAAATYEDENGVVNAEAISDIIDAMVD